MSVISLSVSLLVGLLLSASSAYNHASAMKGMEAVTNRRSVLGTLVAASTLLGTSSRANAEQEEDVYFGVGCFWHIQHEFVAAEKGLLGRGNAQLTARAGYAGGTQVDSEGRVCYHNFQGAGDYGRMGHGEVVGMRLPTDKIGDFATVYFDLFRNGERVDPQDRGGEYRSLIGLPGGMKHAQYPAVERAAENMGMKLKAGKGNDPDTLGKKLVYVYDTKKFPFYQAEVYHQFHDDFQSKAYGKAYNDLANLALDDGRIRGTGCPDRV